MRTAEWIQLAVVTLMAALAQLHGVERKRRLRIALLALFALIAISVAKLSELWMSPRTISIVWDWLPGALMLIPYWQVGQFFTAPDRNMEARLAAFDQIFFRWLKVTAGETRMPRLLSVYLEFAYFLVYPLIPLGVAVLCTTGLRSKVDFYWVTVLSATYVCYVCTLGVRARPPRMLVGHEGFAVAKTEIRTLNREILDRASIHAITFPSAHVASALAAALAILHLQTSAGLLFVWAALSIAAATIIGGYHYVADVLSAALVAILVFAIVCFVS
jgi:PAP2 superfamily